MNINFNIFKYDYNTICITGHDQYILTYDWDNYVLGDYIYSDTITLNILTSLDSNGNENIYNYYINEHNNSEDSILIDIPKDGLYKITHIIIPTKQWFEKYSNNNYDYNNIYYYDNGNIFDLNNKIVNINDILKEKETTSVWFDSKLIFSSNNIRDCFYKHANEFLKEYCSNKKCFKDNFKIFDVIWIGMHVIKYLLDLNRFFEAQYILEKLTKCSGICQNKINKHECNC